MKRYQRETRESLTFELTQEDVVRLLQQTGQVPNGYRVDTSFPELEFPVSVRFVKPNVDAPLEEALL